MMSKWMINRVGLLNFWYYPNQVFQLADGKMLLRGTNGSGKSLTMQSLFPVLFDGDTSAYRLDSFGSRDRKMEDYLLGEKGVSDRDEGVGYLFLETKREDREEYLTIGIGMHANRGGKLTKWFFAIENNQRVGIDFQLFEEIRKDELLPLTKAKLKNRLEGRGRLFDIQREYKKFVNDRIFGFDDIEQFDELISLLINLRSPKLSKEFRPSVIYGILRDSLPKLKDDELLTLSKTIEQIDGHRERLEDLGNELKELNQFSNVYQRWRDEFIGQVSGKWLHYLSEKRRLSLASQKGKEKQQALVEEIEEQQSKSQENELSLDVVEENIQALNQHEGMSLVQRGQELLGQLEQIHQRLKKDQSTLERKQSHLFIQRKKLEEQEGLKEAGSSELESILEDNEQYLYYLGLTELDATYSQKIRHHITLHDFNYWKNQVKEKKNHFQQVKDQLRQLKEWQNQLKELKREEGDIQQGIDELQRDIQYWQQMRQAEIERWKNEFDHWLGELPFNVEEQNYSNVLYGMDRLLEEEIREEIIYEPLALSYQTAIATVQEKQVPLELLLKNLEKQKQEKKEGISEWKAQKIPEPDQTEMRQHNREEIAKEKNFISFYKAVDFLDSITKEERDHIEGALYASGILDSLISPEGLALFDDLQILPQPKFFAPTLADFLTVDLNIAPELHPLVADVLQSIVIDEDDSELPSIFKDGSFQIANLRGKMDPNYQASYIGATSQEQYRQRMILQLEDEINGIEAEIKNTDKEIENLKHTRQSINESYTKRPTGNEVYQAIQEKGKLDLELPIKMNELKRKENQITALSNRVNRDKIELNRTTKYDNLRLEISVYQEAYQYAENYEANLADAYLTYQKIQNSLEIIKEIENNLLSQESEVDDLLDLINGQRIEKDKQQQLIENNQKQQKLINIEELQVKLSEAKKEQKERKAILKRINDTIIVLEKEKSVNETKLAADQQKLEQVIYQESHWNKLFTKEAYEIFGEEQRKEEKAKDIQREVSVKKLKELESKVIQQFNFLADQLQNYQPQLINIAVVELSEEDEQKLGDFASYNNYKQPKFTSEGQSRLIFDLLEQLKGQKLTLQDLLKEDDEKLFKTIILESVGNILRSRINQGMKWIDKMNDLLQAQKNSSGLTLSIQWKGVASTSEYDLGTARLVELLQKDTKILSASDQEAISQHFQEKVRYAQEQVQENQEERSTLFQAIAKVLDYRDWFEFELKFKRSNEGYRPQALTDRRFNQFSGGEKAIAMYLPLFTAVYSRYGEAGDFCPKIITLDEAFAGIDDANISELFKACEELGFNYVMNSQALFGDYATVSKLMIYELLRPQNVNLVTAIQYFWNGMKKQLIVEDFDD
ncbi:TIGR02680 family protein [Desemzia incerta]|uniref:TIGR02680 family protein n=1 Tax=Desemzia incerta TaxID=82801 RepID=UPI001CB72410|nr:TIGR02680 family protein [Desemzia incerta]